jgi:hypothetical protein
VLVRPSFGARADAGMLTRLRGAFHKLPRR